MVRLSIAIMHAPWIPQRRAHVREMLKQLTKAHPQLVAVDVIHDSTRAGVWPTARRAWKQSYRYAASTHHLVLQDDVGLCRNFVEGTIAVLEAKPDAPICLYANRKVVEAVFTLGKHWAVIDDGIWGQAALLPTLWVQPWLMWCERHIKDSFKHDDTRLTMWCLAAGRPVWCPVPSLVDHLEAANSLLGHNNASRVARCFADTVGVDVRTVPWADLAFTHSSGTTLNGYVKKYREFFKVLPEGV